MKIHIFGASGSGTTTLGRALALAMGAPHVDSDDFFWEQTDPPFTTPRPKPARQALLGEALGRHDRWILSGSLTGWGDFLIPAFDLAVFLALPHAVRMARLAAREQARYGDRIAEGGTMREGHLAFMAWARQYDTAGLDMRSRATHEAWMAGLPCPVLRLEGDLGLEEKVARVLAVRGDGASAQA